MTKVAYVTFKRSVFIDDAGDMTKEEIIQQALDTWNEYLEMDDLCMNEEDIVSVEVVEE